MGMERYRTIIRLEEIRSLLESEEYEAAKEVADSIRKEKIKDSSDLFLLSAVYRKCGDFATAKEYLLRIYEKKASWRVLEELMEICLAQKNPEEAEEYLKQYGRISGGDPRNYIYEYRIGRQKHRPDTELLPILQTLKVEEYSEKYAYELAKLYHKLGREQECMAECADLILWFGEGTYVERAKALQAYYRGELSAEDIRMEAERRVQEAEERRAREEEERRAFEEEQRRLEQEELRRREEEARLLAEEEMRLRKEEEQLRERVRLEEEELRRREEERLAEEEHLALESIWRNVTETEEETLPEVLYEEEPEETLAEVAATEIEEPMWEEDDTAEEPEEPEESEAQEEPDRTEEPGSYEQMSLFAPAAEGTTEPGTDEEEPEEPAQEISGLGKELSARLAEKGIVFEEVLHEFGRIERVRKQLVRMLEVVVTVRKKCHCLIITGEKKSGKTTLGTYLAKLLYELSYVKTPRVAKISGERLNQMNLFEKKEQLKDVCLIIEGAGTMTEETVASLLEFIRHTNVLGTVILEDNANAISRLLRNNAECNRTFNNRVHLPKYDSRELLGFALEYIGEQDYRISREAENCLKQQIEYVTRVEQKGGRLAATMELTKKALANADYRNQGTILAMASAGNFLAAEVLELTAEDFEAIR